VRGELSQSAFAAFQRGVVSIAAIAIPPKPNVTEHKSMFESRVTPISIGIAVIPPYLGWSCHRKAQAASDKTMSYEQVVATFRGDSGSRWFRLIRL
jgi:hypothetical protein|tara:strand:+ start:59 stop:346 length:288 start_codon:yes stop_codon:yes gene_type:complete